MWSYAACCLCCIVLADVNIARALRDLLSVLTMCHSSALLADCGSDMRLGMCAVQIMLTTVIVLLFLLLLAVWNVSRKFSRLQTSLNQITQPPLLG